MGIKTKVAGVAVLFKPDLAVLRKLVDSVKGEVDFLYVVDNTPVEFLSDYGDMFVGGGIFYNSLGGNFGIALAQNKGISYANACGCSHVLLLDQDSEIPEGMVKSLLLTERKLKGQGLKPAAIGPVFVDSKTGDAAPTIRSSFFKANRIFPKKNSVDPLESDYVIASGSLIELSVIECVGGMEEELFIDWVDIEWGNRASLMGYVSYMDPSVVMMHSIGDRCVNFLGRKITLHSDFRNYFIVRNAVYLALRRRVKAEFAVFGKVSWYVLGYSWFSENRLKSFALLLRAVMDGVRGKMCKGYFE